MIPPTHPLTLKFATGKGKTKILFLGDSFTHAHEVSSGQAYFDWVEKLNDTQFDVSAVAVGGYGSAQEYLALKSVYDQIQPDVVVWQLTGNDVSNNVYELDNASIRNNQRPRPYLQPDSGEFKTRNPGPWLLDWSQGLGFILQRLLMVDAYYDLGIWQWIERESDIWRNSNQRYVQQGLDVLSHVVRRAVMEFPDTLFIGFSVDPEFEEEYADIFNDNGAAYLRKVFAEIAVHADTDCAPLDTHWNHRGNRIAGEVLSSRINQLLRENELDPR